MNHLVDPAIVDELYAASQAGASIDVIVRTSCALRPGVEGLSGTIRVRSIVGRFLEHSRIYQFEAGERTTTYLGSPDLMGRNLDHRIEIVIPVESARIRHEIDAALHSALADDTNAWLLGPDGEWTRVARSDHAHSHHATMMRRVAKRTRRRLRDQRTV
jgi:polyphosphate kinase